MRKPWFTSPPISPVLSDNPTISSPQPRAIKSCSVQYTLRFRQFDNRRWARTQIKRVWLRFDVHAFVHFEWFNFGVIRPPIVWSHYTNQDTNFVELSIEIRCQKMKNKYLIALHCANDYLSPLEFEFQHAKNDSNFSVLKNVAWSVSIFPNAMTKNSVIPTKKPRRWNATQGLINLGLW